MLNVVAHTPGLGCIADNLRICAAKQWTYTQKRMQCVLMQAPCLSVRDCSLHSSELVRVESNGIIYLDNALLRSMRCCRSSVCSSTIDCLRQHKNQGGTQSSCSLLATASKSGSSDTWPMSPETACHCCSCWTPFSSCMHIALACSLEAAASATVMPGSSVSNQLCQM